ncbi:MAG: hypothetical protein K9I99_03780 [Melioribacteraceae bacterium]|nr:hypothetical protein [Melioribacteraceae bacterium]
MAVHKLTEEELLRIENNFLKIEKAERAVNELKSTQNKILMDVCERLKVDPNKYEINVDFDRQLLATNEIKKTKTN